MRKKILSCPRKRSIEKRSRPRHKLLERLTHVAVFSLGLLTQVTGCADKSISVTDSMEFELFGADLHSPYVLGSHTTITVNRHDGSVNGWTLLASDPSVIRLSDIEPVDGSVMSARCEAIGVGTTDLLVMDGYGHVRATRTIEVKAPDWITLVPAGPRLVMGPDSQDLPVYNPNDVIRLVNADMVTFRVQYYSGATLLHGHKAAVVETPQAGLLGDTETTYLLSEGEWITLTVQSLGTYEVKVGVAGGRMLPFMVEVLPAEAVDYVVIVAQEKDKLEEGDEFYLLARSFDSRDNELFGADFKWTIDGVTAPGHGDLLLATYSKDHVAEVSVASGQGTGSIEVQMSGGHVMTSNFVGCSTAPASGSLPILLALAGILLARRRKRSS